MRIARGWLALATASLVGVAACASATPIPSLTGATLSVAESISPSPTAAPTATPAPGGLGAELEVFRLEPELTDTIYEFASDGESVIFSSGLAEDAKRDAAPDLWRVRAGFDEPPELLWRNPERDHTIVKLAGDLGMVAFVDIPLDGSRAWDLWLIPRHSDEPILLDTHPGDDEVSSLVPSISVNEEAIAWTAFDRGLDGPVSQLLWARAPDWEPVLALERPAADAELWFPSFRAGRVAYSEVVYSPDGATDTRSVYLLDLAVPESEPQRLSHSDLATMPILTGTTVIWKEADPGFSIFNWGKLWRTDIGGPGPTRLDTAPLDYVNYPSAGSRFVAWWSSDAFTFGVYDLLEDRPRVIEAYTGDSAANVLRPHVAWDLLAWLYVEGEGPDSWAELRYAFLPPLRAP